MTSQSVFGALPLTADKGAIRPWTVDIPKDKISRMQTMIELSEIAIPCFENSSSDHNRRYGIHRDWLIAMKNKWVNDFDWKKHESRINAFPHFMASISDPVTSVEPYSIHFVGLFSKRADAVPIIFAHGWPGSFLEFLSMLELVQNQYNNDPTALPYHIIVPSLPGFGFSSIPPKQQPLDTDGEQFGLDSFARILDNLMSSIFGKEAKYVGQGGDIGSRVVRALAAQYPNCVAAHLNYTFVPEPQRGPDDPPLVVEDIEKKALERSEQFRGNGAAYAFMQGTKPSTLGLVLSSNPLAVLAWIGEKYLDWVDPASFPTHPPYDSAESALATEILLAASLYWLSGRIATTFTTYKEGFGTIGKPPAKSHASPEYRIAAPKMLGHSWFPMELAAVPITWLAASQNLVWWRRHDVGGHFAALEQSEKLWTDVEDFMRVVKEKM